jgi:hypothetical protein
MSDHRFFETKKSLENLKRGIEKKILETSDFETLNELELNLKKIHSVLMDYDHNTVIEF